MKIVSLFPAASEIICQLGLSEQLYGVSHECDYPEIVKEKKCVTSSFIPKTTDQSLIRRLIKEAIEKNIPLYEIDDKKISDIGPDLIITQGLCEVCSITENRLEVKIKKSLFYIGHKTKIISLNGTTFDEICSDIIMIGKAVKAEEKARNLVEKAILKKINLILIEVLKEFSFLNGSIHTSPQVTGYQNKLKWLDLCLVLV